MISSSPLMFPYDRLSLRKNSRIFDIPDANPVELTAQQKKEEPIAFTLLFSVFERAFVMYQDIDKETKDRQWSGWDDYIHASVNPMNWIAL